MSRSLDGKWESQVVAYAETPADAGMWLTRRPPMTKTNIKVIRVLIWHWEESSTIFPLTEDFLDGIHWFERENGVSPDKIILPRVIGSHVFGVEVECQ